MKGNMNFQSFSYQINELQLQLHVKFSEYKSVLLPLRKKLSHFHSLIENE